MENITETSNIKRVVMHRDTWTASRVISIGRGCRNAERQFLQENGVSITHFHLLSVFRRPKPGVQVQKSLFYPTNKIVTVKRTEKKNMSDVAWAALENEISFHSYVKHYNICDFYFSFEDSKYVFMVMEYCENGDLNAEIDKKMVILKHAGIMQANKDVFEEFITKAVVAPMLAAIAYLKNLNIAHRAIIPEHVFLTKQEKLKIGDFSLAFETDQCVIPPKPFYQSVLEYIAPEIIQNAINEPHGYCVRYDEKVDVWSLGVLVYEILFKEFPFACEDQGELRRKICEDELVVPEGKASELLVGFLQCCLVKDPAQRPSVYELYQTDLLKKYDFDKPRDAGTFEVGSFPEEEGELRQQFARHGAAHRNKHLAPKNGNGVNKRKFFAGKSGHNYNNRENFREKFCNNRYLHRPRQGFNSTTWVKTEDASVSYK